MANLSENNNGMVQERPTLSATDLAKVLHNELKENVCYGTNDPAALSAKTGGSGGGGIIVGVCVTLQPVGVPLPIPKPMKVPLSKLKLPSYPTLVLKTFPPPSFPSMDALCEVLAKLDMGAEVEVSIEDHED
jgi:hypothetical protein